MQDFFYWAAQFARENPKQFDIASLNLSPFHLNFDELLRVNEGSAFSPQFHQYV